MPTDTRFSELCEERIVPKSEQGRVHAVPALPGPKPALPTTMDSDSLTPTLPPMDKLHEFGKLKTYRGSLMKATLKDYLLYLTLYFFMSSIYRFALTHEQKRTFEAISLYFSYNANSTLVIFVLGFYISTIYTRWWSWYQTMPWPQQIGLIINGSIQGKDDRSRLIRKTMIRYVNLTYIMTMTRVSSRVQKRFPTLQHLVTAGLLQKEEKLILQDLEGKTPATYWVPVIWCSAVATLAFNEKRIISAGSGHQSLISQLENYRAQCCKVIQLSWINVPLLYTQVATLAVYTYILASVLGNQWLDPALKYPNHRVDMYFPFHSSLMFFIFMGLLRAAFSMINPFGEDDEDFEVNNIIDYNFEKSFHSRSSESKPGTNPQNNGSRNRADEYADPGRDTVSSYTDSQRIQ
ncbi:unnamed protein product [Cyprideis torosa]|uniref:Bestrophin homolog n=1 Tax=Cyprideis torosa TaxID=163714 RepID=A0A7R8WFP9_9CRUS|nr:unnamed protein product [Cyprideis torosa]CAG0897258.1 unnamed protein product [Cyprideis torosa]